MKKRLLCALMIVCLLLPCGGLAGYNPLTVWTDGRGVAAYSSASGAKKAGLLYNGFLGDLDLKGENGYYGCFLTAYYKVYVHQNRAMKNFPKGYNTGDHDGDIPCAAYLAQISQDKAPLYGTPGTKKKIATLAKSTLAVVWGEFGDYLFIDTRAMRGFIRKNALSKVRSLTDMREANYTPLKANAYAATVYAGKSGVVARATATGESLEAIYRCYADGDEVNVALDLGNGWVQLTNGAFLEKRFLDPGGDHSVAGAVVKSDGRLNRLNVRYRGDADAAVRFKLCAGAEVEVLSQMNGWATIRLPGSTASAAGVGCVKAEYLATGSAADKVQPGYVRAILTQDPWYWTLEGVVSRSHDLHAGDTVTLIGVYTGFDVTDDDSRDVFLAKTADGALIALRSEGNLEPQDTFGLSAKTTSSVRMRSLPAKDAEEMRTLSKGAKVEVLLRGEGWTMVRYQNETGYVMSRYLRFP